MTNVVVSGSLSGTGQNSQPTQFYGTFNITIFGSFVGTVELQRSFDSGTTWVAISQNGIGSAADYTAPMSLQATETEYGILWRLACTAYTSGTVGYRISQNLVSP